jgi:choline dehydrogenase-like flavoprotein
VENPRLLLASDQVHPGGLGNDHDLVGRYYQDHVGFYGARLEPLDWPAFRHLFSSFVHGRHKFVPKLQLTDAAQCSLQLLNVTGNLGVQLEETAPVLGLRRLYNDLRHGALGRHNLRDLKMLPQAPLESAKILYTHVVQRRIRIPRQSRIFLIANAESEPLRDSRIQLAAERDAYGLRRPRIHWLVSDRTRVALDAYFAEVKRVLEGAGIARVHRNPMLAETNDDWKSRGYSLYHHMGGTRMASRPEDGVVNPEGRVFAMPNLYVAGSSVFPTGSSSNPTFTALALSFRLAEHLAATTPAP